MLVRRGRRRFRGVAGRMTAMQMTRALLGFHFLKFSALLRRQQIGDLRMRRFHPRDHPLHRFPANHVEIGASFFDQRADLFHLCIGQAETLLQMVEHVPRHLFRTRRPHESAADHGSEKRAGDDAREKNQRDVESDFSRAQITHNRGR